MNTESVITATTARWSTLLLLALLVLTGCASMNKKDCLEGNWHKAGYKDAINGKTTGRLNAHIKACAKHGVAANEPVYHDGYESGLALYCVAENGTGLGYRNKDYRGICPAHQEAEFLEHYIRGLLVARNRLNHHYWDVDHALDTERFRRARSTDAQSREHINRRINNLSNKRDDLRSRRISINRKIERWRSHLRTTSS